jgi:hypothetical protein
MEIASLSRVTVLSQRVQSLARSLSKLRTYNPNLQLQESNVHKVNIDILESIPVSTLSPFDFIDPDHSYRLKFTSEKSHQSATTQKNTKSFKAKNLNRDFTVKGILKTQSVYSDTSRPDLQSDRTVNGHTDSIPASSAHQSSDSPPQYKSKVVSFKARPSVKLFLQNLEPAISILSRRRRPHRSAPTSVVHTRHIPLTPSSSFSTHRLLTMESPITTRPPQASESSAREPSMNSTRRPSAKQKRRSHVSYRRKQRQSETQRNTRANSAPAKLGLVAPPQLTPRTGQSNGSSLSSLGLRTHTHRHVAPPPYTYASRAPIPVPPPSSVPARNPSHVVSQSVPISGWGDEPVQTNDPLWLQFLFDPSNQPYFRTHRFFCNDESSIPPLHSAPLPVFIRFSEYRSLRQT